MSEDAGLSALYVKKRYVYEDVDSPAAKGELDCSGSVNQNDLILTRNNIHAANNPEARHDRAPMLISLSLMSDHLNSMFVYHLTDRRSQSLLPLSSLGSFFQFVPARLGVNKALDCAIACVCGIYSGTLVDGHTTSSNVLRQYSKSLYSLRTCVDNHETRLEAETLCASILLQFCEVRCYSTSSTDP